MMGSSLSTEGGSSSSSSSPASLVGKVEHLPGGGVTFYPSDKAVEESKRINPFDIQLLVQGSKERKIELLQGSPNLSEKGLHFRGHSFVHSAAEAYNNHHHLVIRPDDVWMAIMNQFSVYVDINAEKLRDKFVDFQGKKELEVRAAGSIRNAPYDALARMMEEEIAKNIKDPSVRSWVVPNFSTTTQTDRVVGAVVLMAAMKNYFDYKFSLCCGLPKVTLLGTVEDWKEIRGRAERILEFDAGDKRMGKWGKMLFPVLDKLVESAEGKPDLDWWQKIANHVGGGSGPTWLSGWITVFTVFSDDKKWMGDTHSFQTYMGHKGSSEWIYIDTNDIPKGYLMVPVTVDDNGTEYKTEMYAGHIVSKLENGNTTIVPQLDWCIVLPH